MSQSQQASVAANSPIFSGRCVLYLFKAAIDVMAEASNTPNHAARVLYAEKVLGGNVQPYQIALMVFQNAQVLSEVDSAQSATDYGVPDNDIEFTINSIFNALAGIST